VGLGNRSAALGDHLQSLATTEYPILLWQPIGISAPWLVLHQWPVVVIFVELELLRICMPQ
jgi:hypothetical protein